MSVFSSKAGTLKFLENIIKKARVLPQICLNVSCLDKEALRGEIEKKGWQDIPLIVRSSSCQEDSTVSSLSGHFLSVLNVLNLESLYEAIDQVIASYGNISCYDQIFIQPMLQDVTISGVAFSQDPKTGAQYRIINYDEVSGSTSSVTSGTTNDLSIYFAYRLQKKTHPTFISQVIELIEELESLFLGPLDVEFAITKKEELVLFQVRPLIIKKRLASCQESFEILKRIELKIEDLSKPHPYLLGHKSIFGVMPDWNPAEIIGIRPSPLALSIYKEIITDSIWACQRDHYGYRSLKNFPLLVHFYGLPYIDVRVSFNSFIPADLDELLAEKLANYYLAKLEKYPQLHDKIEFEIVYSCYDLDLPRRVNNLKEEGFTEEEITSLTESLRRLTHRIIDSSEGLYLQDLQKLDQLEKRFKIIQESSLSRISKIYWFVEDCKLYGTLPFAGIARAAFIAVQIMRSLVEIKILSKEDMNCFFSSLNSISSQMKTDRINLETHEFLNLYGHLREGTYDILSPRYDEFLDPGFSLDKTLYKKSCEFKLSATQVKQIEETLDIHGLKYSPDFLFTFIKSAIEAREYSKFLFTKSVSEVLRLIGQEGQSYGYSLKECAYLDIQTIKKLYSSEEDIKSTLMESIVKGKRTHGYGEEIILPPLITSSEDVWAFNLKQSTPNYITLKKTSGRVCLLESRDADLAEKIVMIPSADPGYDWIFMHPIRGFITMYGGINSHMAIRAAEAEIPAIIGAGEVLYQEWSRQKSLEIDCENKTVRSGNETDWCYSKS